MSSSAKLNLPTTLSERVQLGGDLLQFKATWKQYLDLLEKVEYNIEFDNTTITTMSIASFPHEVIVSNIITQLNNAFEELVNAAVCASNMHVYIEEFQADFAPDAHVIKGKPKFHELRKGLNANTNPWVVVEVLSPSTRNRDVNVKLPKYKKIKSLKHIIYIAQDRPFISVFHRKGKSDVWENIDYDKLSKSFEIAGKKIALKKVYRSIDFK